MNEAALPYVSIVVIGLNEENNLNDTFNAALAMDYPQDKTELIYVDTGSDDRSVEIARKYTDKVYVEECSWPSSGLARNRGIQESGHEIIHFIDGDIAISKNYLKEAVGRILLPGVDAVTGYFVEKHPEKFFNRLLNIRRDDIIHKERLYESTNGGGTYKRSKLISVNGYDERILKGQESELGVRYREKGYKILFIDIVQGVHNFDINSMLDFIRFKFNYGRSFGYLLKIKEDEGAYIRRNKKASKKILLINSFSLATILISVFTGYFFVIGIYYGLRLLQVFFRALLRKKTGRQFFHDILQYIFSFATYLGILYVMANTHLKPGGKYIFQNK
jgi:glycosyltransferase involved in cell wall biosynthesis